MSSEESEDRHASRGKRRTQTTEDEANGNLQPLQKKQRISTDTAKPLTLEKEHESIGSTTEGKGRENAAILPPAASVETRTDRPALSVPRQEDSVHEVISKLTAILDAVRTGRSIAEITTDSAAPNQCRDLEVIAGSQMPPLEYEAWTTFNDGLWRLPELDWENNKLSPPISLKSLKVARRRAEALNRLYKTDRAHEGHVTWITQNKIEFLPLIKATARVIGAERNLVGGGEWRASQLADLQLVNRILSISAQICQRSESKLLRLKGAEVQHVLGNYRRTLQASRLRKSVSISASEEGINEGTKEESKEECNESQCRIPPQFEVEKVFPEHSHLRLHRLIKCAAFNCDRCGDRKISKLVAFAQDQDDQPVCNGCYGRLCSTAQEK